MWQLRVHSYRCSAQVLQATAEAQLAQLSELDANRNLLEIKAHRAAASGHKRSVLKNVQSIAVVGWWKLRATGESRAMLQAHVVCWVQQHQTRKQTAVQLVACLKLVHVVQRSGVLQRHVLCWTARSTQHAMQREKCTQQVDCKQSAALQILASVLRCMARSNRLSVVHDWQCKVRESQRQEVLESQMLLCEQQTSQAAQLVEIGVLEDGARKAAEGAVAAEEAAAAQLAKIGLLESELAEAGKAAEGAAAAQLAKVEVLESELAEARKAAEGAAAAQLVQVEVLESELAEARKAAEEAAAAQCPLKSELAEVKRVKETAAAAQLAKIGLLEDELAEATKAAADVAAQHVLESELAVVRKRAEEVVATQLAKIEVLESELAEVKKGAEEAAAQHALECELAEMKQRAEEAANQVEMLECELAEARTGAEDAAAAQQTRFKVLEGELAQAGRRTAKAEEAAIQVEVLESELAEARKEAEEAVIAHHALEDALAEATKRAEETVSDKAVPLELHDKRLLMYNLMAQWRRWARVSISVTLLRLQHRQEIKLLRQHNLKSTTLKVSWCLLSTARACVFGSSREWLHGQPSSAITGKC